MADLTLTDRNIFRAWNRVSVRYNDLDPLGHVNNTAMAIFLEQARCELITPMLKAHGRHLDMVLASTKLDYLHELKYPGIVEIGTIATRVGTKSLPAPWLEDLASRVSVRVDCDGGRANSLQADRLPHQ